MRTIYSLNVSIEVSANEPFETQQELESYLKETFEENGDEIRVSVIAFSDCEKQDDEFNKSEDES